MLGNIHLYNQEMRQLSNADENDQLYDGKLTSKQIQKLKEKRQKNIEKAKMSEGMHEIHGEISSGIQQELRPYLLNHFTLCLVGKPGSGKSTLMKYMIEEPEYYKDKFDDIFVVSPSIGKLELKIPSDNTHHEFDFDWIYDKIHEVNQRQVKILQTKYMEQDMDANHSKRRQKMDRKSVSNIHYNQTLATLENLPRYQDQIGLNQYVNILNRIYRDRQPSNMRNLGTDITTQSNKAYQKNVQTRHGFFNMKQMGMQSRKEDKIESRKSRNVRQKRKIEMIQRYSDEAHKLFKQHVGSKQHMSKTHVNVLLILDDVIGDINKEQHTSQLGKLFLNRRHLIANGTVSIIVATQKYTMIPSRIRSNANWMILFRLNPNDFELVRTDATSFQKGSWEDILKYIFGQQVISNKIEHEITEIDNHTDIKKDYTHIALQIDGNSNKVFKNQHLLNI